MNRLIIVIGAYGSGKSEYAINLAKELHLSGKKVALADLDVVNPYFRSRDVQAQFAQFGIEVIAPQAGYTHADLPMISPRMAGAIRDINQTIILDVGGDPTGCRALARFTEDSIKRGYEMHFVINTRRPFTNSVGQIKEMQAQLEKSSGLQITEVVCNTNLMEFTTSEIVEEGIAIVAEYAQGADKVFKKYLVLEKYATLIEDKIAGKERKVLSHFLNKPWEEV